MLPPPGEALWALVVESERRVAGDVFFKNGHMDRDWRRRASMAMDVAIEQARSKLSRIELENECCGMSISNFSWCGLSGREMGPEQRGVGAGFNM